MTFTPSVLRYPLFTWWCGVVQSHGLSEKRFAAEARTCIVRVAELVATADIGAGYGQHAVSTRTWCPCRHWRMRVQARRHGLCQQETRPCAACLMRGEYLREMLDFCQDDHMASTSTHLRHSAACASSLRGTAAGDVFAWPSLFDRFFFILICLFGWTRRRAEAL